MAAKNDKQKGAEDYTVSLPQSADILEAEHFHKQCRKALSVEQSVVIDASKVERLTTPVIQLILALEKALTEKGQGFRIVSPSAVAREVFATLGLSSDWSKR